MLHLLGVLWRHASVKHGERLKNNIFYLWEGRCIRIILETFCAIIIHAGTIVLHIGILALALGLNIFVGTSACTMQDDQSILMLCLIMQLVSTLIIYIVGFRILFYLAACPKDLSYICIFSYIALSHILKLHLFIVVL